MPTEPAAPARGTLGVVAGGGSLPIRLVEAARAAGREVFVVAVEGQAERSAFTGVPHAWVRLGAMGRGVELLRRAGVRDLVLAGRVRRPSLTALRPDRRVARFFAKLGPKILGDDSLLSLVVRELEESEGFRVVGPDDVLADLLAPEGTYGAVEPDDQAWRDIRRGVSVVRALGSVDVGQAAVVQQGIVLAVEAIEGTDAMLERASSQRRGGPGGVLVKLRKPGQERRIDLPTIGVDTVAAAAAAGLCGIAIEAGGSLVIDRAAVTRAADAAGLFVVGLSPAGL